MATGAALSSTPAFAQTGPGTFDVDNAASASCSDSTTNSAVTPYCTIQAAVNAASTPGDIVIVQRGSYAPFSVTHSGTGTAPITIESTARSMLDERSGAVPPTATILDPSGSTAPAVSVNGQSNVVITGFRLFENSVAGSIDISGSSHITFNSGFLGSDEGQASAPEVSITSDSSYVTISRSEISTSGTAPGVLVQGGSHETLTTNWVAASFQGPAIVLEDSPSAAVTSNFVEDGCGTNISVTDGSTAASIQNNLIGGLSDASSDCTVPESATSDLLVDSSSTTKTVVDYNDVGTDDTTTPVPYSWAGVPYTSVAAFQAATGQSAHDSDPPNSVTINSANSNAPGELPSDADSFPWVQDPLAPVTGAGLHPYYDRGAFAVTDPLTLHYSSSPSWTVGTAGTLSETITDGWGYTITACSYDFGDGTPDVTVVPTGGVCTVSHAYSAAGHYPVSFWVSASDGSQQMKGTFVTVT